MDSVVIQRRTFAIGDRCVGDEMACFIIAEAGVNHNGSFDVARQLIDAAAAAGVDAVKFQTFRADELVAPDAPKAEYQTANDRRDESQLDMLRRLEIPSAWYPELIAHCERAGLIFLSTPFDDESARLLAGFGMLAFKVPSGELTNLPYLSRLATFGRPLIVSTGMAVLHEVEAAIAAIRDAGDPPVVLLHCVSRYPTPIDEANVRALQTLRERFNLPVGYSDHTEGLEASTAAVALGACVVEKHLTLSRGLPGPDHLASVEPHELAELVRRIRLIQRALGSGEKAPSAEEREIANIARKSLITARALPCGHRLAAADLVIRRPGTGLPPSALATTVGRRLTRDLPANHVLALGDLAAEARR